MEWQNAIRAQLMAQQAEAEYHRELVDKYRRLARTARELKVRNQALLRGGAVTGGGEGSTPPPLVAHLDNQLTQLRAELSQVYRTQAASQNKQLSMADALRDRDEEVRGLREEVRELRDARDAAVRREREWDERWKLRTKDLETLNDEIISQNVEIAGLTQRNTALQADNANLLQRWIDKMNLTADEMNDAFEEEAKAKVPAGGKEALSGKEGDF